jgi:hypothetical protein
MSGMPAGRVHGLWQTVYVAPSQAVGAMIKDYLSRLGFLVTLRSVGGVQDGAPVACEVLVPAVEAADAHQALTAMLASRQASFS